VVVLLLRMRADAGDVAAGARLGHGDPEDRLAAHAVRQEACLLLVAAELADVGRAQPAVQRQAEAGIAVQRVLLQQDLLEAEVLDTLAAVGLVGPHQAVALLAGLAEQLAVDDPGSSQRSRWGVISACRNFATESRKISCSSSKMTSCCMPSAP
jgi:hypothetical protein